MKLYSDYHTLPWAVQGRAPSVHRISPKIKVMLKVLQMAMLWARLIIVILTRST
ncbi:hypothetical protein L218DRAFT_956277 [Marasmius fiardii PR-910]|nr:hypothetical protein L218DRAFT_956277 [Marasmius fiardii PR-910]